jgi:hypothetical protein
MGTSGFGRVLQEIICHRWVFDNLTASEAILRYFWEN